VGSEGCTLCSSTGRECHQHVNKQLGIGVNLRQSHRCSRHPRCAHRGALQRIRRERCYAAKAPKRATGSLPNVIDLLTEWRWLRDDPSLMLWAASRSPLYERPIGHGYTEASGSVAAIDEIQEGLKLLNKAKSNADRAAANNAIDIGHDHLVIAARKDVGRRKADGLTKVLPGSGAGRALLHGLTQGGIAGMTLLPLTTARQLGQLLATTRKCSRTRGMTAVAGGPDAAR
jgi:hypothetical protein